MQRSYPVIVIGGGHAGVEAAWAAANLLAEESPSASRSLGTSNPERGPVGDGGAGRVALVTLDPAKIGVMSCNPAIGGLAKGQMVREIDALGGLMGLATDATGIMFKMLNTSKGPAVHGPRAQCDKHAYAEAVQHLVASRPEIDVIAGAVEEIVVDRGRVRGVVINTPDGPQQLAGDAVILTTGTFMRGLMHTGEARTPGGRAGESAAAAISDSLRALGFELGRLKTGTPPRLDRASIDWDALEVQEGDADPTAFSVLSEPEAQARANTLAFDTDAAGPLLALRAQFPALPQVTCRITHTTPEAHELIRDNLHRAPMFSGQIESLGPRYCPSIEDKVVRFADRPSHHVFLEPESLRDDWIYCNGISTSLPADVQNGIVRAMPGCGRARILRYGYAVEYDMVRPHQILPTCMTRRVEGLFLAGQINGTSGYEEAAGQGLVAGVNAVRYARGESEWVLGREEAYIGVMMDDLVTRTPREPYRMFTSRAEHRLLLRADNASDRLTPIADRLGLLSNSELGLVRRRAFERRTHELARARELIGSARMAGEPLVRALRRSDFAFGSLCDGLAGHDLSRSVLGTVWAEARYEAYIVRERAEIKRRGEMEHRTIPGSLDWITQFELRNEAREALARFSPRTFGQASRLEGVTPADLTLVAVLVERHRRAGGGVSATI